MNRKPGARRSPRGGRPRRRVRRRSRSWLVAVPLVALAAFAFRLPVPWVYFVLCLDEFEKMLPCWLHYRRFEWMKNITRDKAEIT